MTDCLTLILQGDIFFGITCTWTNLVGLWFYALMLFTFEILLIIKFDNLLIPSVIGIIVGMTMLNYLPPELSMIPVVILILNISAVLYSRFVKDD